jgi:hypothetical protein
MKKIIIALPAMCLVADLHAQIPEKKSIALVHKLTATWCPPCGGWGWQTAEELIAATEGKALFMSLYVGNNGSNNELFKNPVAEALAPHFTTSSGLPSFGVNGVGYISRHASDNTIDIPAVATDCVKAVDSFAGTIPLASPACKFIRQGNTLTANARVRFWAAAKGDYYLAAYLVEDSAINTQRTPDSTRTAALHHKVLRGSMSGKPFGELVASGDIKEGQQYDKTFRFTVTDPRWNMDKLNVYVVIWRKEHNDYRYVNAGKEKGDQQATFIDNNPQAAQAVLYPNPASQIATLSITSKIYQVITIHILDMNGRRIGTIADRDIIPGNNIIRLPLQGIASGTYQVLISSPGIYLQRKLSVIR